MFIKHKSTLIDIPLRYNKAKGDVNYRFKKFTIKARPVYL